MKLYCSILFAVSSVLWSGQAGAGARPHYGGTLRIGLRENPRAQDAAALPAHLSSQIFETLVRLDDRGRPEPLLATSWEAEASYQRWRFLLRNGVSFHDGVPLDAATVAASLRGCNPEWKVFAVGESVMIQTEIADSGLLSELALSRNSIRRRASGQQKTSGTGPFTVAQWVPGKHLTLKANDSYWGGRPFLDSIEVEFGKSESEQKMLLDLAKADAVEIGPEDIRRAKSEGRTVMTSEPEEFLALIFAADARSEDDTHARNALAASIDSVAINNVVFQGGGDPSGALLPNWLSGYGFIFSPGTGTIQQPRSPKQPWTWTLAYDTADPVERVVAERILLNARDAGINLQLVDSANSTLRLARIPLPSLDPEVTLDELAGMLQLPRPMHDTKSVTELYSAETILLQSHRIIPLLHLRSAVALRPEIHNWHMHPDGSWTLADVWLSPEQP
jgi:peptide/nickel transport system substrate-binding protein